jgi:rRNA maturation endonuclease Nob1
MKPREIKNCEKKKWFLTRQMAKDYAKRKSVKSGCGKMFPYECPICGNFHLTSQERERDRRIKGTIAAKENHKE